MCAACSTPRLNLSSELRPSWDNIQDMFLIRSAPDATGVQRLDHGADHSPPSSAKVRNEWSCTFLPPLCLHGRVHNVTQSVHALLCATEVSNLTVCFSKYYSYLNSTRRARKARYKDWGAGYTTKESGFNSLQRQEIFLSSKLYVLILGPNQSSVQ